MSLLTELHDYTERERRVRQSKGSPLFAPLFNAIPSPVRQLASKWLKKSDGEREALSGADLALLVSLRHEGHLSVLPHLHDTSSRDGGPSAFYPLMGEAGYVNIQSDYEGKPAGFKNVSTPTMARWFVLLHEVAHQEFHLIEKPFRPSEGRGMSPKLLEALNHWSFGSMHTVAKGRSVLNECFADTYSTMLMLSSLEGDTLEKAKLQVKSILRDRHETLRTLDESYLGAMDWEGDLSKIAGPHMTAYAVNRVLESVDSWRGSSPEQLRQSALEIASDGFLDALAPSKLDARAQFPLGWAYRWSAMPEDVHLTLSCGVGAMAIAYLRGANLEVALTDLKSSGPEAVEAIKELLPELKNSLEKSFPGMRESSILQKPQQLLPGVLSVWGDGFVKQASERFADEPAAFPARQAFERAHSTARLCVFQEFIEKPSQELQVQLPSIGKESIQKERRALGLEVEMPSLSAWRTGRAPIQELPSPAVSRSPVLMR